MPKVVLLPNWNIAPSWNEIIGKVFELDKNLPQEWRPGIEAAEDLEQVEAFAFPTPFAWAEMMSAVLRQGDFNHLLFNLYADLVMGVTLGLLQLEITDIKDMSFGSVLASSDERYRYFGLLRANTDNRDIQGKVFGATSPETLFWPSPRRTKGDWQELKATLDKNSARQDVYALLADFRDLITQQRLWSPDEIPWMKGLEQIIGNRAPSEGNRQFHVHSRFIGPIYAKLPKEKSRPLYFPVAHPQFASQLLEGLTGSFEQETNGIAVLDDRRRKHYEVRMPSVPQDGDSLLAGAGNVELVADAGRIREFSSTRVKLQDENGRGLFSLLQPLDEALLKNRRLYRSMERDVETVKSNPFFFPDIIRITVARLGEAGIRGTDVSFSDRAFELALKPESPGLPLASELSGKEVVTLGLVLEYTQAGKSFRAFYIDKYAGYDIGDLKAVGWVLWAIFTGKAEWYEDQLIDETGAPLLRGGAAGRPFDITDNAYKRVVEEREANRRLAALQRFVKAYNQLASPRDASKMDKLCEYAAVQFATYVWGGPVIGNGRESKWQTIQTGGLAAKVAVDQVKEKAYGA